jgi:hypothetical protein
MIIVLLLLFVAAVSHKTSRRKTAARIHACSDDTL